MCWPHDTMRNIGLEKECVFLHLICAKLISILISSSVEVVVYPTIHVHVHYHVKSLEFLLRTLFCCRHHGSCKNHPDARIFLHVYMMANHCSSLFIQYIGCLRVCQGKVFFFVKRSAVHLDRTTRQKLCLFKENMWLTLTIVSDVFPPYFFSFVKGVVNVAHFRLKRPCAWETTDDFRLKNRIGWFLFPK